MTPVQQVCVMVFALGVGFFFATLALRAEIGALRERVEKLEKRQ